MIEPLCHYVIVRRDLPLGVMAAQLVHAAGESFFKLSFPSSSEKEHRPIREDQTGVAGSNPASGAKFAQVAQTSIAGDGGVAEHSVLNREVTSSSLVLGSIDVSQTTAVVLGARNEGKLLKMEKALLAAGVPHVAIREPDAPWNGQLMAIGLVPGDKSALKRHVADFHRLPELAEAQGAAA